jgi:uracil-DNA glycosylase family 4
MTSPTTVPNLFPTSTFNGIAIIGEAPGKDEEATRIPFIGASGRLLDQLLSKANILRPATFIGNVCQIRPPANMLGEFDWNGPEIQSGIAQLQADLAILQPNIIIALGNTPLHLFMSGNTPLRKRKTKKGMTFIYPNSIDNWRGSRFLSHATSPLPNVKTLASYHPAYILRNYEDIAPLIMDLQRASRESTTKDLILPQRILDTSAPFHELLRRIHAIRSTRPLISLDIEGNYQFLPCISIATDPLFSFIVPFSRRDGASLWTEDEEVALTRALAELLADPNVPKVWQNGLYDRWSLQYGHRMPCFGNAEDTMPKWWEKYCELRKALGVQTSILTDEQYYKGDIDSQDDDTFFRYCCKDSAVTLEISRKLDVLLAKHHPQALTHYRLNHDLLNVFLYIELRGMLYDHKLAKQKLSQIEAYIHRLQAQLDDVAGTEPLPGTPAARLELINSLCAHKRDTSKIKKEFQEDYSELVERASKETLSEEDKGFILTKIKRHTNVKSIGYKSLLYETLMLPKQWKKNEEGEMVLTTDYLALTKLSKKFPHPAVTLGVEIGLMRTRAQMLAIAADPDGRIRSSYNGVGTNTGRVTSSTSPTGSGYNLQTVPDDDHSKDATHPLRIGMRRLVLADPEHWMFQCDLKGSDGWTIGAWLNYLGDSTMLDDLRFGIKPAQRIAYMLRHGNHSLKGKTRSEILELLKEIKKTDWDYFACKVGIWGLCYLMGPELLADQIFEESEGKVQLSHDEVKAFKLAVFEAYSVERWHSFATRKLKENPILTSASGHTRRFYNRPEDALGQYLAHEPQSNTTYATNMAARNLWMDPENREDRVIVDTRGKLLHIPFRIEPLHQVHDALIGQFRKEDTEWAVVKIRQWFDNSLTIAGQRIVIPFEGNYGPSWGDQSVGKI